MNHISRKLSIGLAVVAMVLAVFAGCTDKPNGPSDGPNVTFDISYETFIPKLQQRISNVHLTITGIGIDPPIDTTVGVAVDGTFELVIDSVPSGPGRVFLLELLAATPAVGAQAAQVQQGDVVLYRGVTVANVAPDVEVSVPIKLVPTVPMLKLTPMTSQVAAGSSFFMNLVAYNMPTAVYADVAFQFDPTYDRYLIAQPAARPSTVLPSVFYQSGPTNQSEGAEYGVQIGDFENNIPFTLPTPTVLATIPFTARAFTDTIHTVPLIFVNEQFSFLDSAVINMFPSIPVPVLEQSQVQIMPLADREVTFPDPQLYSIIHSRVYPNGGSQPIMLSQVLPIAYLDLVENAAVKDLTGINQLMNLEELTLSASGVRSLAPVTNLKSITYLTGASTGIRDLSPIAGLTGIWYLDFSGDSLTSIAALTNLKNLQSIYLGDNRISDLRALAGLTNAYTLDLRSNNISDISPLAGMLNLSELYLNGNNISSIAALATQPYLYFVNLANNNITDITALIINPGISGTGDQVILTGNTGIPPAQIDALAQKGVSITGP